MSGATEDTIYLWLSSDNKDAISISVTDFHVVLTNRIANPVSADLVQVVFSYTSPLPNNMFISSRALGQSTVSGSPNGSGLNRWWRAVPWMSQVMASNSSLAFYNPRLEHTPVKQDFLQDIDIQLTDAQGVPVSTSGLQSISVLVAVKVKRQ